MGWGGGRYLAMLSHVYTWFSTASGRFWYQDCTLYDIKIADYGLSKYNEEDKNTTVSTGFVARGQFENTEKKDMDSAWGSLNGTHLNGSNNRNVW